MMWNRMLMGGVAATALVCSGPQASAAFMTGFETSDDPGYVVGNTITGVDGWVYNGSGGAGADPGTVSTLNPRSGAQHFETSGNGLTLIYDRSISTGPGDVVVKASVAMNNTNNAFSLVYFDSTIGGLGASTAVQFGFSGANIVYRDGGTSDVIVAPWVAGRYYDFTATTDFANAEYDLLIEGTDVGGVGVNSVTVTDVDFRVATVTSIGSVRVFNNSTGNRFDVDDVSVAIPEPGSIALMSLGGLILVSRRRGATAKR